MNSQYVFKFRTETGPIPRKAWKDIRPRRKIVQPGMRGIKVESITINGCTEPRPNISVIFLDKDNCIVGSKYISLQKAKTLNFLINLKRKRKWKKV